MEGGGWFFKKICTNEKQYILIDFRFGWWDRKQSGDTQSIQRSDLDRYIQLCDRLISWLIDRLVGWPIDRLIDWLINRLIDWLINRWIDGSDDRWIERLMDWAIERLMDRTIDGWNGWLIDNIIDDLWIKK